MWFSKKKKVKPFNEQCFLLENIRTFALMKERSTSTYENLGLIKGDPGHLISRINHGGAGNQRRDDAIEAMLDLCPEIYALLTPYIRIYRVIYEGGDGEPFRIASDYDEENELIPFTNYIDADDIGNITDGKYGRVPGAGIKEFSWALDGVQPEDVENNIAATLTCHFQSLYDLFKENIHNNRYQAGIPGKPGFLDLIIGSGTSINRDDSGSSPAAAPQPVSVCGMQHNVYHGERFRLKAVIGWATPPGFASMSIPGYNATRLRNLENAINLTRKSLFLQITGHELSIQDDGSVTLVASYQAALSGILTGANADILKIDLGAAASADPDFQDRVEQLERDRDAHDSDSDAYEGADDLLSDYLEGQSQAQKQDRLVRYERFLKGLFTKNTEGKTRIYTVGLAPAELVQPPYASLTEKERAARAKRRTSTDAATRGFGIIGEDGTFEDSSLIEAIAQSRGDDDFEYSGGADALKTYEQLTIKEDGSWGDNYVLPYFYLGDLVDAIIDDMPKLKAQKDFQLMFSQIHMIDPIQYYQKKSVQITCDGNDKTISLQDLSKLNPELLSTVGDVTFKMFISSLPVSLIRFNQWFASNVVKKDLNSYFLLQFITDLLTDLVSDMFSKDCFGETLYYKLSVNNLPFLLADNFRGKVVGVEGASGIAASKGRVDEDNLTAKKFIPTNIIYSVSHPVPNGDFRGDLKNGIYHYYFGAACGLLKTVSFSRMDNPYHREARTMREGILGAEQLRELYQVNMEMIGNTLHKNGGIIYFNPVTIGRGIDTGDLMTSVAKLVGLAGYFMIISVKHIINDSGFSVNVSAYQQGISQRPQVTGDASTYDVEAETPPTAADPRYVESRNATSDNADAASPGVFAPPTASEAASLQSPIGRGVFIVKRLGRIFN